MEAPVEDRRSPPNLDATQLFCESCGHSEFVHGDDVHGDDDDGSCLYLVCQCSGFSKRAI